MIKIEKENTYGWEEAIRGMRNPLNSWERSDSLFKLTCDNTECGDCPEHNSGSCNPDRLDKYGTNVGHNDHELMMKLAKGGPAHAKYRRMITVYADITAPLYWWKEFDTYKVGTVVNSCSTMHKIHAKEFTLDDFSCEHLIDSVQEEPFDPEVPEGVNIMANDDTGCLAVVCHGNYHEGHSYTDTLCVSQKDILDMFVIPALNANRETYLKTKDKKYWWQMIQLLPSSYNQKRTVMLNYEVLNNMYHSRKNHKLDEWVEFCKWVETLPYSELITGKEEMVSPPNICTGCGSVIPEGKQVCPNCDPSKKSWEV